MPKKRIPMAQILSSRDGTLSKDAKLVNCMVEKDGEKVSVVKRPGTYLFSQFPTGLGQGMFTINGVPYAIFNDVLYLGIAPFSGLPLPVGSLPPPPAPAPLPQYAIFIGGLVIGGIGAVSSTSKYSYTSATMQSGAYMLQVGGGYAAYGNYSVGVWFSAPKMELYTYSGDIVTNSSSSYIGNGSATAVGNLTEIIISSGFSLPVSTIGIISKYQYSNDSVSTTTLQINKYAMAATGNSTQGLFGFGASLTSNIYLYSNDTISSGTSFVTARQFLGAAGETTRGIFSGGINLSGTFLSSSEKYTYSGDVVSAGTSLSLSRSGVSATGNTTVGIFSGGTNGTIAYSTTDVYTYSSDAVAVGASLLTSVYQSGAVSTSPGGF